MQPDFFNLSRDNVVAPLSTAGAGVGQIANNNSAVIRIILSLSVVTSPRQSSANCKCEITPPVGFVSTSYFAGTGDTAKGPYFLLPGDFINLTWTGGPASGQGIGTYWYIEVPL